MANYSDIRGYRVKYLSSDPTLSTANEGQVWYNSTSGTLKSLVQIKAWSSGGNLNTGRRALAGAGTSNTSGLAFGGINDPTISSATEEYNGYSWANSGNLGTARRNLAGAGTQTAGLAFGGLNPISTPLSATEAYDGATWTAGGALGTARGSLSGTGTQTAGLAFGGSSPPPLSNLTEEYNGSSWTTVNNMNTGRRYLGGCGSTQTAALAFGGGPPNSAATEQYDGTNWVTGPNMGTARYAFGSAGTLTSALAFGGELPPFTAATEEYNSNIQAISKDVWASGGTVSNTSRNRSSFGGTQTAGTLAGGYVGANNQTKATEEYNGTSWAAGGDLIAQGNPPGGTYSAMATGTQTAGLFGGGTSQGTTLDYYFNTTMEYDGSTWSSPTTFPSTGRQLGGMFGTQTAAVLAGGYRTSTYYTNVDKYNGTAWTTGTGIPTATGSATTSGTETAGLFSGGYVAPSVIPVGSTYTYDGSTWTTASPMSVPRSGLGGSNAGTQTASVVFSGYNGPTASEVNNTESYDGSVWSSSANMATTNSSFRQGSGTAAAALSGGGTPSAVEEFTGGSSVITASTLTTS